MIQPQPHIGAMSAYALADMSVESGKQLISMAQNESILPPSPKAIAAAQAVSGDAHLYPDPDWTALRSAIADVHELDAEKIVCGAGSMELIGSLIRAYAGPGDEVLSTAHAYAQFKSASIASEASYVAAEEDRFMVSVDALLAAVTEKTKIVCVANPGNPTGTRVSDSELVRLRDGLHDDVLLLIDEAYGEFADGRDIGTFDMAAWGDTVVLRTFSKAYGLAGMRVGWGVFPSDVAANVRKLLNPNNVSVCSQAAAAAAMADQSYMRKVCAETIARRDRFAEQMRVLGLTVPRSYTNFVLIRFPDATAASKADVALRSEGILMRGMKGYGLPDCLRATIAGSDDMALAYDILSKSFTEEHSR